jgi:hypothetical protein
MSPEISSEIAQAIVLDRIGRHRLSLPGPNGDTAMTGTEKYTATEIADIICKAQGLTLGYHTELHNRLKYVAKRGMLRDGKAVDGRGTLAFPKLEIFRAAVFVELIGLAMDVRALTAVNDAADRLNAYWGPIATSGCDASYSQGGLKDAVRSSEFDLGGDYWFLKIWRVNPGRIDPEYIKAAFVPGKIKDEELWGNSKADEILGRKPTRAHVSVDLSILFRPIVKLVNGF